MDTNDKRNQSGGFFGRVDDTFSVKSATSGIGFAFQGIDPPPGHYIGVDDSLEIMTLDDNTGNTYTINVRVLAFDGLIHPFKFTQNTNGLRTPQRQRFQLMEGYILSAAVTWNGAPPFQQIAYCQLGLVRTPFGQTNCYFVLCSGYVGNNVALSYPTSGVQRLTDGAGIIAEQNIAAPAAGADIVVTVPVNARWRVVSLRATLTTAVAVANRDVTVTYDDGINVFMESPSNFVQAASITNIYNFWDSAQLIAAPFNTRTEAPLPSNCLLGPGFRISTATGNIQAADQWSAMRMLVIAWQDNP